MVNNTSGISISKNLVLHPKTKQILMKYHFLQDKVMNHVVRLECVATNEKNVNIFTMPLPRELFEYF